MKTTEKRTWGTMYNYKPKQGQVFLKQSLTVPDMSLSIQDIMIKALGGNLPALSRNVAYGNNTMVYSIPLDITEVETSARNIKRRLDAKRQEEEAEIQEKNRKQAEIEKIQKEEFMQWKETQKQHLKD